MKSLPANTAKTKFGELLMKVQREPIQINKNGAPVAVVISYDEYQDLEELKLKYVKSCFEHAERDIEAGNLVDGEEFISALESGQFD